MEMTFNQALIFLPMMVVVGLCIVGFMHLVVARMRTINGRDVPLKFYVAFQGATEPEATAVVVRHYANLFEAPIVFYAACLSAFALQATTDALYITAWVYALARLAQSIVHLSYNNVRHRALAFVVGWLALTAMWVQIGLALLTKI
ncbi:MAG: MAPEG family protein [Rhodospirillaceae bacterium]|nr:MAPEG family protein [Rhodospirillaceae bacterium]